MFNRLRLRQLVLLTAVTCFLYSFKVGNPAVGGPLPVADTLPVVPLPDSIKIFEKIEIEPSVSRQAWIGHLEKNLQPLIEAAAAAGMKPGTYTIEVKFLVEKNGSISQARALSNPGYGLAAGAARVVRTGPHWTPGLMAGRPVRSYHTQPITFVISK